MLNCQEILKERLVKVTYFKEELNSTGERRAVISSFAISQNYNIFNNSVFLLFNFLFFQE